MKGTHTEREPLAIIGMACRFPGADTLEAYWANILNGTDCITDLPVGTHWKAEDYFHPDPKKADHTYAKRGGFLNPQPFEPLKYGIPPKSIEATDTTQLIGMIVAREAMEDAGYGMDREFSRERVSCILGVTGTLELAVSLGARLGHPVWRRAIQASGLDEAQTDAIVQKISDGFIPWNEQSFPGLLGNVVAGRIANYLDLSGTNCVSDAACASALSALNMAANELWSGQADMVISGGVDTFNDIFMYMCFSKTPALSPTGDSKPFSAHGDGTILGEGAGIVVMKRLSDALAAGDKIYATLRSVGTSSDGKGNAIYAPNAKGQTRALRRAYEQAGLNPSDIQMVEGHGTGTVVGDGTEISALAEVFASAEDKNFRCAVGSVKSQIGHTKAAAGAAGLIKAILAMRNGVLPPSIKVDKPLPDLTRADNPLYLNTEARPWTRKDKPRRAGVSAFGFGGSNFHAVVEEYPAQQQIFWDGKVLLFPFSAKDNSALKDQLRAFQPSTESEELALQAAEQVRAFKHTDACRLILIYEQGKTDLAKITTNAIAMIDKFAGKSVWSAPEGIYYGANTSRGKLGVLFPGQGSQYCNMLRDLSCRFPAFQNVLTDIDNAFLKADGYGESGALTDIIYPVPAWDEATRKSQEENLRRTEHAQPAIGAVSIGLLKVLNQFGVYPEAAAGHSYGEIPALCASDRFETEALFLLSRLRGQLMAQGDGDRGSMLAVRAPLAELEVFVRERNLDLVLANKNAPNQIVLSGTTAEIERAQTLLEQAGKRCKRLPVAAAFHSALVAQASQPFYSVLQDIDFPKAGIPVYSNTTGKPYPESAEESRSLLANQLSKPVEFIQEIRNMFQDGVTTFLEVGPGASLTGLVKSILENETFEAIAMDASSGRRMGTYDLGRALAQLATLGYPVNLTLWEQAETRVRPAAATKKGLVVPITGANYVSDETKATAKRPVPSVIKAVPVAAPVAQAPMPVTAPSVQAPKAPTQATPVATAVAAPAKQTPAPAAVAVAPKTSALSQPAALPQPKASEVPTLTTATQNPVTVPVSTTPGALHDLLNAGHQHIQLIQKMQENTARLHTRFLQGQDAANQTLLLMMQQQQQLLLSGLGNVTVAAAPMPQAVQAPEAPKAAAPVAQPVAAAPAPKPVNAAPVAVASPVKAAPAPAPAPVKAAPAAAATSHAVLQETLLRIVSEKTGYPVEMLEPAMSLDGDLGIDSIKRVEIFSGLQEALPGLPSVEPDVMGSLTTLADILSHLGSAGPQPAAAPAVAAPAASVGFSRAQLSERLLAIVAEKTGYPIEMLEPTMSLDGDLGIDSIKRVEIFSGLQEAMPGLPSVEPDVMGSLGTLNDILNHLASAAPAASAPAAQATASVGADAIRTWLFEVVAEKTGYPTDMLEPAMSLDGDLGIDSIKRVEILSGLSEKWKDAPEVKPEDAGRFVTLADILTFMNQAAPAASVAPVASVAPAAVASAARHSNQEVEAAFLSVVADKTGYPTDMLEHGMSLDGDLGIDSIKRVEIFSTVQERFPEIGELRPDKIAGFVNLGEVIQFLNQSLTQTAAPATSAAPAPVAAVTAPAVAAAPAGDTGHDVVRNALLKIVAEKTGYPIDMLEWHMGLESDLGIDSIKRVEILSGLADSVPGLPEPRPDEVGSLHTLAEIAEWYTGPRKASTPSEPAHETRAVASHEPTRVSRQVPRISHTLFPSTLIDLAPNGLVWLAAEPSEWTDAVAAALRTADLQVDIVPVAQTLAKTRPSALTGLLFLAPDSCDATYLENALMLVKHASPALRGQGKAQGSFLACVTHLDGLLGFDGTTRETFQAGLLGLAKTAHHEWPEVNCKAIDVRLDNNLSALAAQLVDHLRLKGNLELGLASDHAVTVTLHHETLAPFGPNPLQKGDVVLVSGGARGVTAACAIALAQRFQPTMVLLGRSPLPQGDEPSWARGIESEVALKQAIMQHSGVKHTPKTLQAACNQLLAEREMRSSIAQMTQFGATVIYRSVDMRDATAVAQAVADIRNSVGPIRGLVHGAGVLADRLIEDKTPEQFQSVFSTKVQGMAALLQATAQDDLRAIAFFSSSTGRFGRTGQVDYAMSNEILNKTANQLARQRPNCRVVSPNWGPWDGGMVTPELKKLFHAEGIEVIPIQAGATYLADELSTPTSGPVEVVILGETEAQAAAHAVATTATATVPSKVEWEQALQIELNLKNHPFLRAHVLGGKAVLPSVMMMEWCGHAAMLQHVGYQFAGFRNFRVLKGVTLDADATAKLEFQVGTPTQQGDLLFVPTLMQTREKGRAMRRCSMDIVLTSGTMAPRSASLTAPKSAWTKTEGLYDILFHGPIFQGLDAVTGVDKHGIAASARSAEQADTWMPAPLRRNWLADPLALDCAFQLMVLWSYQEFGQLSLPVSLEAFHLVGRFPRKPSELRIVAHVTQTGKHKVLADMEILDGAGNLIARLDGYECVLDRSLDEAYRRRHILEEVAN